MLFCLFVFFFGGRGRGLINTAYAVIVVATAVVVIIVYILPLLLFFFAGIVFRVINPSTLSSSKEYRSGVRSLDALKNNNSFHFRMSWTLWSHPENGIQYVVSCTLSFRLKVLDDFPTTFDYVSLCHYIAIGHAFSVCFFPIYCMFNCLMLRYFQIKLLFTGKY